MEFYKEQLASFELKMEELEHQPLLIFSKAEMAIKISRDVLEKLRRHVLKKGFKDREKECFFFKNIKPKVVGCLIHFLNLIHIERELLYGTGKGESEFLMEQISQLRNYFSQHQEFYEYYIRKLTDRDHEFFLRKSETLNLHYDSIPSMVDTQFSTTHDMQLAKMLGNLKTIDYLKNRLDLFQVNTNPSLKKQNQSSLKWTGNKVDLVELVYALHSSGIINYGQADLKEIAEAFETTFHTSLGDYYRTFLEIRERKIPPTKFLNLLKTNLQNRVTEADG